MLFTSGSFGGAGFSLLRTSEIRAESGGEPAPSRSRLGKCLPFNVTFPSRARKQAVSSNSAGFSVGRRCADSTIHLGTVASPDNRIFVRRDREDHAVISDSEPKIALPLTCERSDIAFAGFAIQSEGA
jgi:hypothetical protein